MRTKTKTRMSDCTKGVLSDLNCEDLSFACVAVISSWMECVQIDAECLRPFLLMQMCQTTDSAQLSQISPTIL